MVAVHTSATFRHLLVGPLRLSIVPAVVIDFCTRQALTASRQRHDQHSGWAVPHDVGRVVAQYEQLVTLALVTADDEENCGMVAKVSLEALSDADGILDHRRRRLDVDQRAVGDELVQVGDGIVGTVMTARPVTW